MNIPRDYGQQVWEAEEILRLREINAELLEACRGVLDAFEAGVFIRDTSHDHESDWGIKAYSHLRALGKLAEIAERGGRK